MAMFSYTALLGGARREGMLQADSMSEAARNLRGQGMLILSLNEAAPGEGPSSSLPGVLATGRLKSLLIRNSDVETALGQLGALLTAGIPLLTALNALAAQAPRHLGARLRAIAERVRGGAPLSRSARAEAPFLGENTLGLIEAGEANGTVAEMLKESAHLMGRVREIKSRILQAFSYPTLVALGAVGVAIYMVRVVFPKVLRFIEGQRANIRLPAVSRALIDVSEFTVNYGIYMLLAPVALAVVYGLVCRTDGGSRAIGRTVLALPLLGKAFRAAANAMWTRILGTLVHSGIDIVSAIDLARNTLKNAHYRAQFDRVREIVRSGRSLSEAIGSTDLARLCPMAQPLVSLGEQTGGIDDSLLQVASDSESALRRRTDLLSKMVEPAVFLAVGGMVGFVYYGFFLAVLAATRSAG